MAQIECEQMISCKEPGGLFVICSQEISHCGEISVRARVLPRETQQRETLLAGFYFRSEVNTNLLDSFYFESKESTNPLGSFLGAPKKRRSIFLG